MKTIGMRNLKTALSVFICVILSQLFNRQYIFYAAVAAVISMQSSVLDSFKAGENRMLGTIVGGFVGLLGVLISPGNAVLCGIGIIIIIYVCDYLGWKKAVTISCTVFLVIMLSLNGREPLTYAINRVGDTFLGIIVAVFVNYGIYPPRHIDKIYTECILAVDKVFIMVEDKICFSKYINLNSLQKEITKLETALSIYLEELKVKKQEAIKVGNVKELIATCKKVYMHLEIIESLENEYSLNKKNYIRIIKLFKHCDINEDKNNDISIVYNYHLDKILDNLYKLKNLEEV